MLLVTQIIGQRSIRRQWIINWKECTRKRPWPNLRYCPGLDGRRPGRDSNQSSSEYSSEALSLESTCSVDCISGWNMKYSWQNSASDRCYNEYGISLPDSWLGWFVRSKFRGYSALNEMRRRLCAIDLERTERKAITDYFKKCRLIRSRDWENDVTY
jgi:hypothetical protein